MRIGVGVVRGRSMEPTYRDGDRLLLLHGARPRAGRAAVVRLPGSGVVAVKRVVRREAGRMVGGAGQPGEGVDSWTVGAVPDSEVVAVVLATLVAAAATSARCARLTCRETP